MNSSYSLIKSIFFYTAFPIPTIQISVQQDSQVRRSVWGKKPFLATFFSYALFNVVQLTFWTLELAMWKPKQHMWHINFEYKLYNHMSAYIW